MPLRHLSLSSPWRAIKSYTSEFHELDPPRTVHVLGTGSSAIQHAFKRLITARRRGGCAAPGILFAVVGRLCCLPDRAQPGLTCAATKQRQRGSWHICRQAQGYVRVVAWRLKNLAASSVQSTHDVGRHCTLNIKLSPWCNAFNPGRRGK